MTHNLSISVQNVSKQYRIWDSPSARIRGLVWQTLQGVSPIGKKWFQKKERKHYRDFKAVDDISFDILQGESVAIIGRNGSGKSTLLQLIAGTLQPTSGYAKTNGRIAALLELGSGFDPEFTGRENVYLNASILGLSQDEINERFDAIASFAEIGEFMEQPVRTYSSGMVVRLAFAVMAHVEPDILIVDEALAVVDARFQLKCARTIDRFIEKGTTLLFVSHDLSMVKRLCQKAILLERGQMLYLGIPNDTANLYSKLMADGANLEDIAKDIKLLDEKKSTNLFTKNEDINQSQNNENIQQKLLIDDERAHAQLTGSEFNYGGETGQITHLSVTGEDNIPKLIYTSGEKIFVRLRAKANEDFPNPIFALTIKNIKGIEIYGINTMCSNQSAPSLKKGEHAHVEFSFFINLMPGYYFLSFGFVQFIGDKLHIANRRYDAIQIEVCATDHCFGIANLHAKIKTYITN
jgi:ABC-type polysaccharide/polyol phosphate transport system ATPase subunit